MNLNQQLRRAENLVRFYTKALANRDEMIAESRDRGDAATMIAEFEKELSDNQRIVAALSKAIA
jgi:hypothetical protein